MAITVTISETLTNKSSGTLYLALKAVKDKYPKT